MIGTGLTWTIEYVKGYVDLAVNDGGSGLVPLLRRLEALTEPPPPPRGRRAEIAVEHATWTTAITDDLLPSVEDAVADALRASRGSSRSEIGDPWSAVDHRFLRRLEAEVARRKLTAQEVAVNACRLYARSRKVSFLREAVGELEAAVAYERSRRVVPPTISGCAGEKERLGRALQQALPDPAFRFFARLVRARIGAGSPLGSRGGHYLSDDGWDAVWVRLEHVGRHFAPAIQAAYDAELEAKEREEQAYRSIHAPRVDLISARDEAEAGHGNEAGPETIEGPSVDAAPVDPKPAIHPLVAAILPPEVIARATVKWRRLGGPRLDLMTPEEAQAVRDEIERQWEFDATRRKRAADRVAYERQLRGIW